LAIAVLALAINAQGVRQAGTSVAANAGYFENIMMHGPGVHLSITNRRQAATTVESIWLIGQHASLNAATKLRSGFPLRHVIEGNSSASWEIDASDFMPTDRQIRVQVRLGHGATVEGVAQLNQQVKLRRRIWPKSWLPG
jgi:hypothetical protein